MALLSPAGIGVKTNGRSAWLDAPAAESYQRMRAAGCPAGGITDAGRTRAEQVEIYTTWLRELSLPVAQRKYKGSAAKPGESKHETGRALDLAGAALEWVRMHGREYGWLVDQVKGEQWHVEYHAAYDKHAGKNSPEDDMPNLDDTDIRRIREEAVYPMLKEAEIGKVIGEAVWTRLIDGVQAWVWLRDARLAADTPDGPVAAGVAELTDDALARIARAVADETDRRARVRLG